MIKSWVRWVAVFTGGLTVSLPGSLLQLKVQLKVQQENLQPTLVLKIASLSLIGLGFGLPWLLFTGRHSRHWRS